MNIEAISQKRFFSKLIYSLPFLPVVFFFLHNTTYFTQLIFTNDVFLLFLAYTGFAFLLLQLLRWVFHLNMYQSLFLSTLLLTIFLFFGVLQDWLYQYRSVAFLSNSFFILFILLSITFLLFFLIRRKPALKRVNFYLLTVFLISLVIDFITLGVKLSTGKNVTALAQGMTHPVLKDQPVLNAPGPDIYHILFDSYANSPTLEKHWGYKNEITPYLATKGFYTVDSATSNYISTPFSVASIFNMQYLEGAEPYLYSNSANFLLGQRAYENNELFRFLKKQGYTFSIFSQLESKKLMTSLGVLGVVKPNVWLRKQTLERIYLSPWMLEQLNNLFGKKHDQPRMILRSFDALYDYNLKALQHIREDCNQYTRGYSGSPVFSYTHFLLPHDPYIIDETGKLLANPQTENTDKMGYLRQLKYCNNLIREITECLLSDTTRKKIIIFHGDHGFRHYADSSGADQFGALDVMYFYDRDYSGLNKTGSLVNLYRIILNKYFGTQLPLLPNRTLAMETK